MNSKFQQITQKMLSVGMRTGIVALALSLLSPAVIAVAATPVTKPQLATRPMSEHRHRIAADLGPSVDGARIRSWFGGPIFASVALSLLF